jgi:hypothetical protein
MLTLNDGRSELWQWDTGRTISVDVDCSQVHFSNKVFGRSIDVDAIDGIAIIPDILLQTDKELTAWAFVGTPENGYTKISKVFKVNKRNKPADYVFTPPEQTNLGELIERLDKIEENQDPDAIKNAVEDYLEQNPVDVPVESVNGKTGAVELTAEDVGAISQDDLQEATNDALAQAKASGEFNGKDGQDGSPGKDGSNGVSATHSWNGTTLTVTSASGTSSANLKGEKGDKGDTGATGANGKDGTSVTVKSVSESTADGGSNVVTFSDGKTLNVKNGSKGNKGDPGTTPQKGIDFWTPADQEAIVQQVITALGTPVFGTVDANKVITITTDRLVDGTYTLRAENEDGSYTVIGTYTKENEPTYTNLFVAETCTLNKRGNSSGTESACDGVFLTDYIDIGDVMATGGTNQLHYKGMYFDVNNLTTTQGAPYTYLNYYNASKTHLGHVSMRTTGDTQTEAGDYVTTLDAAKTTARYIRVSAAVSPKPASTLSTLTSKDQLANIKITLNETITD